MHRALAICLLTAPLVAFAAELQPGQVWSYQTRQGEAASTVTILKVEDYKDLGRVIHVRIDGLHVRNPRKGTVLKVLPHMPFKERPLRQSLTKPLRQLSVVPDFRAGYDAWKASYVAGGAGVLDASVAESLDAVLGVQWDLAQ